MLTMPGLSLCIQGTLFNHLPRPPNLRFIPVHTGNIPFFLCTNEDLTVYPCAYREHINIKSHVTIADGLSLCIQGTSLVRHKVRVDRRFIPVHTGNI